MTHPLAEPTNNQPTAAPTRRGVLAWAATATVLLAGSGVVRSVQAARHRGERDMPVECPFALKTLPRTIGDWEAPSGGETVLNDLTTRITGATDYIIWKYANRSTGATLSVLVLYGPAEPVMPHTPQVCYPATGFQAVAGPANRAVKLGDGQVATFRVSTFAKPGGREVIRNVVYHSFYHDGVWRPDLGTRLPRQSPGIFKVQIQRRVIGDERPEDGNEPIERFLQELLPIIDQRVAAATPARSAPVARA